MWEEMWNRYHDITGEWFPTMCFPTESEEQMLERMSKCVEAGKTAEEYYNLPKDVDY